MLKGFRILDSRYKTFCGEIDIVAKKGNLIVFVEVKTRKDIEKCYNAIRLKQIRRIQNASNIFLKKNKQFSEYDIRYDVILISSWKFPIHLKNVSM